MSIIHKRIVTDEMMHAVAVQIDYSDWLKIEKKLGLKKVVVKKGSSLAQFAGKIKLKEDPLKYQIKIREEW